MSGTVTFVVDLDVVGAPPAADSVRQLLALIDVLQGQDSGLDWRLKSISMNSPLRAVLDGFDREGQDVPEQQALAVVDSAFSVLSAVNDNADLLKRLPEEKRKQLRTLLTPLKRQQGTFRVIVEGRPDRVVRSDQAQSVLDALTEPVRIRRPEFGSIEGHIFSAGTHYGKPAVRVRTLLTGAEVLCIFEHGQADLIGADHTLAEIWSGKHVVVSGLISFDNKGVPSSLKADDLKLVQGRPMSASDMAALALTGRYELDDWGATH